MGIIIENVQWGFINENSLLRICNGDSFRHKTIEKCLLCAIISYALLIMRFYVNKQILHNSYIHEENLRVIHVRTCCQSICICIKP